MNDKARLARAIHTISVGFEEWSQAIAAPAEDGVVAPVAGVGPSAPAAELSPFSDEEAYPPQGSLANCPKHRIPYTAGTYGPYCKEATDDPAWGTQKGDRLWCRISPRNAAEWLRNTA